MSKSAFYIAGVSLSLALAAPASAQLVTHKDLSLAAATTIAVTALETCKAQGYNVSVHVLGREGQVLVALRNPLAGLATYENSMKKAYTARTLRIPSGQFAKNVAGNPNAGQFFLTNFVAAQGALPIMIGQDALGAVGISGAPGGDKDEVCAKAGIDKIAADLR
ncbi:MAG: heme-binding protein [Alphaproteobacteria bacterium]|nr:heme-binding protein [Alphaproteobacteria bacterium]